jgi:hypothetical protein
VWRSCNINADFLLIVVVEAKCLSGNNSTARRRNTRRRLHRSAKESAGEHEASRRSLVLEEEGVRSDFLPRLTEMTQMVIANEVEPTD